ncbi:MAG: DNA mismatch repair endonuclease MutL, partial [bacterium]
MEGKIQILDEAVANKIAAGEVIERPAAVVKELLENAVDAGASQISIEIEESGSKLIKVTDNGCGMIKQDVVLALERHATSKIRSADDLFRIHTLGFRGEAMPSIAAVSLLEITTKTRDDLSGTYLKAVGGEIKEIKAAGCPDGTTVTVRDLFFNTPARLKYLRSGATEMGHIIDLVNRISLAYPDLSLRLTHNGRQVLFSSGSGSLEEVIFNVFGKQMAENMLPVNTASERITLTGYVGKPVNYKSNRSGMIFFVNGRYIKDRLISRAVEEAFKGYMLIRKYPVVVLNFTIEPETIDVNVHPTKTEIRFSEEKELYTLTYQTVSQAIKRSSLIPEIE